MNRFKLVALIILFLRHIALTCFEIRISGLDPSLGLSLVESWTLRRNSLNSLQIGFCLALDCSEPCLLGRFGTQIIVFTL